jgi:hypothetical protein
MRSKKARLFTRVTRVIISDMRKTAPNLHHTIHISIQQISLIISGLILICIVAFWSLRAAGTPTAFEAEAGSLGSGAGIVLNSAASGGKAVAFAQPNCPPMNGDVTPDYQLPIVTNGLAPILSRIPTQKRVVFLTIDNGNGPTEDTPPSLGCGTKASVFIGTHYTLGNSASWFAGILAGGSVAESFTADHANFVPSSGAPLSYDTQKADIALGISTLNSYLGTNQEYASSPKLFRAPFGNANIDTQKAVYDLGLTAIIKWDVVVNEDSTITYGSGNISLHPGDIVLMHFYSTGGIGTSTFAPNIAAFDVAAKQAGLVPVLLEDWLK